ncbi:MAG: D-alanine--D-alanine ligase [Gammaproteobacteria bacterium]|jgi:D-alanine-D-alanine ligase
MTVEYRLPACRTNNPEDFGRVAVLLGGSSAEREISLKSGGEVLAALRRREVDAHPVDPREGLLENLEADHFDRVFIALHGRGGEDGTVQGALEFLGLPYTGSGVLGSALSMDKMRTKQIWEASGIPTPNFVVAGPDSDPAAVIEQLGLPLFVKPAREGSSIGMTKVVAADGLAEAIREAAVFDDCVLVERFVEGAEYTASVLGDTVLPMIRLETPRDFYDYEAKYFSDTTRYHCPCGLPEERERQLALEALRAFRAVGASGWGRVDFMLSGDGEPRFLEVNTVPGMTDHSLVPMSARAVGVSFDELVWRILETTLGRRGLYGAVK